MPAPGEDEPSYFAHTDASRPDSSRTLVAACDSLFAITLDPRRRQPDPAPGHPRTRRRRRLPIDHRTARPEPGRADLSLTRRLQAVHRGRREERYRTTRRRLRRAEVLSLTFHKRHLSCRRPLRREAQCSAAGPSTARCLPRRRSARPPTAYPAPSSGATLRPSPAAALVLSAFLSKHAAIFKSDTFAPVCESYFDDEEPRGPLHRPGNHPGLKFHRSRAAVERVLRTRRTTGSGLNQRAICPTIQSFSRMWSYRPHVVSSILPPCANVSPTICVSRLSRPASTASVQRNLSTIQRHRRGR